MKAKPTTPAIDRDAILAALATALAPSTQQGATEAQDAEKAPPEAESEPAAYDVRSFCKAHSISRNHFFKLRWADQAKEAELGRDLKDEERRAPRCKEVGRKIIISREAARAWRNR